MTNDRGLVALAPYPNISSSSGQPTHAPLVFLGRAKGQVQICDLVLGPIPNPPSPTNVGSNPTSPTSTATTAKHSTRTFSNTGFASPSPSRENGQGFDNSMSPSRKGVSVPSPQQQQQQQRQHHPSPPISIIAAHNSDLTAIAISHSGHLVATASETGTLVRVFETKSGRLVNELRRGLDRAEIYCVAFNLEGTRICVASDKGTVHVFNLGGGVAGSGTGGSGGGANSGSGGTVSSAQAAKEEAAAATAFQKAWSGGVGSGLGAEYSHNTGNAGGTGTLVVGVPGSAVARPLPVNSKSSGTGVGDGLSGSPTFLASNLSGSPGSGGRKPMVGTPSMPSSPSLSAGFAVAGAGVGASGVGGRSSTSGSRLSSSPGSASGGWMSSKPPGMVDSSGMPVGSFGFGASNSQQQQQQQQQQGGATGSANTTLAASKGNRQSSLSFFSPLSKYFNSEWSFAQFSLPSECRCICGFALSDKFGGGNDGARRSYQAALVAAEGDGGAGGGGGLGGRRSSLLPWGISGVSGSGGGDSKIGGSSRMKWSPSPAWGSTAIVVVCADGSLYKYSFDPVKGGECVRESYYKYYRGLEDESEELLTGAYVQKVRRVDLSVYQQIYITQRVFIFYS
ncbi:hypothetical protein HDU76_001774 [Blyttiomyces sp. JEL0837]|nr:hypothetical protein HDU76_001774 [Blyttiomyces sp. JEL0837]